MMEWLSNNHEEIRTAAFIVAGIGGFLFAWWRARIADKQANAAQQQSKTAEKGLLNEQFKSGVELFTYHDKERPGGSLVTRFAGVVILTEMAKLYPETLHMRVMELFVNFLHYNPSRYDDGKGAIDVKSPDNRAIMDFIKDRTEKQKCIESEQGFDLEDRLKNTCCFRLIDGEIQLICNEPAPEEQADSGA